MIEGTAVPPTVVDSAPPTDAQRRTGGANGPLAYVERVAVELDGPLDRVRLETALRQLTTDQQALRCLLRPVEGTDECVQLVHDTISPLQLIVIDAAANDHAVLAATTGTPKRPTDSGLFEVDLVRCGTDRHVLVVRLHHLFSDGWSYAVLFGRLGALYGDPAAQTTPPIDYAAVCRDLVERRSEDEDMAGLSFWRRRLAGIEPVERIVPDATPHAVHPNVQDVRFLVAPDVALQARRAGRAGRGGALAAPAVTAVALVLAGRTRQYDVRVATLMANRPDAVRQELVGFFANLALLRITVDRADTVADLLGQVETRLIEAQTHEDTDFVSVLQAVIDDGGPSPRDLYSTLIVVNTMRPRTLQLSGLSSRELDAVLPSPRSAPTTLECRWQFDLRDDRLHATLTTPTQLFEREAAAALRDELLSAFDAVGRLGTRPVGNLIDELRS